MDYKQWSDRLGLIVQICTLVAFAGAFVVWLIPDLRGRIGKFFRTHWRGTLSAASAATVCADFDRKKFRLLMRQPSAVFT